MLIGIDLGTSSVRVAVVDEAGRILGLGQEEYPIEAPRPGWAEQDPEAWWRATCLAARQAISSSGVTPSDIDGIGFSGQMHGAVLVDASGDALGKAIIWADGRSDSVAKRLNAEIGDERLATLAGNRVAAGFMAATLAWMREHSPSGLEGARWALLPKDYLRLRMGGPPASEPSDASATLLYDIAADRWSSALAEVAGVDRSLLPPLARSHDVIGVLSERAAEAMSLRPGIPLVAGAGDQAAQAVGNGVLDSSMASCSIGTGGQILQPMDGPRTDPQLRVHCFRHARPRTWFLMAATLSAGLSLRWWRDLLGGATEVGYEALDGEAQAAGVGIVVRSVLLKGALTHRWRQLPEALTGLRSAAARVEELANGETAELAYRYVLNNPLIHTALVGTCRLDELEATVRYASRGPLPEEVDSQIRAISVGDEAQLNPGTWQL